ncbi:MAG: Preprotein translocase, SecG subunit [Candidatus Moranbacteria bacterium GW2011_GWE2_35_2-]|nr:MAG: Preprotein translocase, SecG subunit [Candidatus Moranbacteria bacterium GW2011_GWE2_35_2-]KKQ04676.1 MAG: Preprotein translocase, SecG subunit [Candidatus Moranbacteria bacterium GW2011_GWF1_36_4]KKQ22648.1 MAG: Preprotein translocase, SecG subunit [Candidatus Moranbacteria bacterium GW2011_GWF2_37_11]KKQ29050.1 MAG: Preprotein translocase, SecG subunit [Candidatus Moranbacteria bacterium GW2011_GWD1_37_17]KKQ30414.1 MAG: Preprotein translocase, SecG subunit [Candidatus Moranbacteria b
MKWISILQIITSILLIISILLQNRGSGLGAAFGGDMGGYYAKRGFEKFLVYFSVALAILFMLLAALNVFIGAK